jgi:phosphopantothenoylcysteine decarboxylase/phosphopantothenate--cysteine ligase
MYKHPSTRRNIETLLSFGHFIIEPTEGELASGLCGAGRMEEPENIVLRIKDYFEKKSKLVGKKVLITAGPTYEAIDPVRFIGNHSTGKMGFAIAQEMANRGAEVILIAGPVSLPTPKGNVNRINVKSAKEMYNACHQHFGKAEISILSAAVADFLPKERTDNKIKKEQSFSNIELSKTEDILFSLVKIKNNNQLLVGFALETDNEVANAISKLHKKNLDLVVLNSLQDEGAGFGHDTNMVTLIDRDEHPQVFTLKSKVDVAKDIIDKIESLIHE